MNWRERVGEREREGGGGGVGVGEGGTERRVLRKKDIKH